jgi:hypothetical protein
MTRVLLVIFLFFTELAWGQFTYQLDQSIPVEDIDGNLLEIPWAGGLNAVQYNKIDLNADQAEDLVLFDRMANKVITFLNVNNKYRYSPEYEYLFPDELTNWMLLKDFNCDGKKDIFTADLLGIRIFVNNSTGSVPSWNEFLFYSGVSGPKSDVILTKGFSGMINLQIQFDDLPAIVDADSDGDLDIFNIQYASHGIEFHRNMSAENGFACDSMQFERITRTWGNFKECHCGEFAFNGSDCAAGGRLKHAGGKSLLALDANGDQTLDLVFSEAECTQLYLFPNEGTLLEPVINTFSTFPANAPVDLEIFPAAFYEDVDFDGIKDLLATPNVFTKEHPETDLESSNWFYKNIGTNASPDFNFVQNNFLQNQMIDVGDNAVPALADMDGDGDQDLFISRNASSTGKSTIICYKNIGTALSPAFRLETNDFLDFSSQNFFNLKIQFTDVDNNNSLDLVFTATDLTNEQTRLYFLLNKNQDDLNFEGETSQQIGIALTNPENVSVIKINNDEHIDLLIGKSNGAVQFWKGAGSSSPFILEEENFLDLQNLIQGQYLSVAAGDLDGDSKEDLAIGDQDGLLRIISDFKVQPLSKISEITFPGTSRHRNFGGRIWPAFADLFNSGKPSLIIGNLLGGLQVLKNENAFNLFPSPVSSDQELKIQVDEEMTLRIYSSTGRLVEGPVILDEDLLLSEKMSTLSAGLYIFRFDGVTRSFSKKVVVR